MANAPVNKTTSTGPINGTGAQPQKFFDWTEVDEYSTGVSLLMGIPKVEVAAQLEQGTNLQVLSDARGAVDSQRLNGSAVIQLAQENGLPVDDAVNYIESEQAKREDWVSTNNLYLDQVVSVGDADIDATTARYATNLTIGEQALSKALSEIQNETSWVGYGIDFIDRFILRATLIGGFEDISNRREREGKELLEKALTMDPVEYKRFIEQRVQEWKDEGIITGDNVFSLMQGLEMFENAGVDRLKALNIAFGALDAATLGLFAGSKAVKLARSTTALTRIAALKGGDKAADAGEALLKANSASPDPQVVVDMGPGVRNPGVDPVVSVNSGRVATLIDENEIIANEMLEMTKTGARGRSIDSPEVKAAIESRVQKFREAVRNPLRDIKPVYDATGNVLFKLVTGTVRSGKPYAGTKNGLAKAQAVANKLMDEFPTAKVEQVDPTDAKAGYVVTIEEYAKSDDFVEAVDLGTDMKLDPFRRAISRLLGSKANAESRYLNQTALMAEGVASAITGGRSVKKIVKAITAIDTKAQRAMSKIYGELRDGADSFKRENYSLSELKLRFKDLTGREMTQKDIDGFEAIRTLNDADWIMRAHIRLTKMIHNDYVAIVNKFGDRMVGRKASLDSVGKEEMLLDVSSGKLFSKADVSDKVRVFKLAEPMSEGAADGVRYIFNPVEVKVLDHTDVLGYNAGGRRINPDAKYFLVSGAKSRPSIFMYTFTEEQARKAVDDLNAIRKAILEAGGVKGARKKAAVLNDLIVKHSDWNGGEIQTVDEFLTFLKDEGINLKDEFTLKPRDGAFETDEVSDGLSDSWGEMATFNLRRGDKTLSEYGGGNGRQYDPVKAIFDSFGSSSQQYAHNVYTNSAMSSWTKAARQKGSGWIMPNTGDFMADFRRAVPDPALANARKTTFQRNLDLQKRIIDGRLGQRAPVFRLMQEFGKDVQEYVFSKSGGKIRFPDDPGEGVAQAALNFSFVSAFGFLNMRQLFMQGFHSATLAASVKGGFEAAMNAPSFMMALNAPTEAMEKLFVSRIAKGMGLDVKDVEEMIRYTRTSGRDIIDGAAAERGTGNAFGVGGGWMGDVHRTPAAVADVTKGAGKLGKNAMKLGLTPYRWGEAQGRFTGLLVAMTEFKRANPGKSLFDDAARRMITDRDQALTFRMTNANRAAVQEGFGKMPTQWLAYSLRSFENVAIGRDFTAAERARLALVLGPMFGATGFGAGQVGDWLAEKFGVEAGGEIHTLLKRGLPDFILQATTGQELALAEGLAPMQQMMDLWRGFTEEKTAVDIALGPSGSIGGKLVEQIMDVGAALLSSGFNSVNMTEEVLLLMRQFTGLDNAAKAFAIIQNGQYRSRTGRIMPFEMTIGDAIGQALGFSPREVADFYSYSKIASRHEKEVRNFSNEMTSKMQHAWNIYQENPERGLQYMKEIAIQIDMSGFSTYDITQIRRGLRPVSSDIIQRMIQDAIRRGDTYSAETLSNSLEYFGEN